MRWSAWRCVTNTDRTSGRSRPKLWFSVSPARQSWRVGALAAVDEVGGVTHDDGVGVPRAGRLRVGAAGGPEQHQAVVAVDVAWRRDGGGARPANPASRRGGSGAPP